MVGRVLPEVSNVRTSILAVLVAAIGLLVAPWSQAPAEASWTPGDLVIWPKSDRIEITFTVPADLTGGIYSAYVNNLNNASGNGTCVPGASCTLTPVPANYASLSANDRENLEVYIKGGGGETGKFRIGNYLPQYPTPSLSVSRPGLTAFDVSASGVGSATKFCFRVEQDATKSGDACTETTGSLGYHTSSSFRVDGLNVDRTYYVWLRVGGDDGRAFSEWVGPQEITTLAPNPQISVAEFDYAVRIGWSSFGTLATENRYRWRKSGTSAWTEETNQPSSVASFDDLFVEDLINGQDYQFQRGVVVDGRLFWGSTKTANPSKTLTASNFSLSTTTREYDGTRDVDVGWIDFDITGFIDADGDEILGDDGQPLVVSFDGDGGDGGGPALFAPDGSPAPVDPVTLMPSGQYDDADVGDGDKDVVLSTPQVNPNEAFGQKYTVSSVDVAVRTVAGNSITARPLNLSNFRVEVAGGDARIYDGTTTVADEAFSDDRVAGDDITFSYTLGELPDKNVATDKPVQFTDIAISGGADGGNYDLQTTSGTALVDVTARPLTLSAFAGDDKVYDATTDVVNDTTTDDPDGDTYIPDGSTFADDRVAGDELTFAYDVAFVDTEVGTDVGVDFSNITVSGGADAANYALQTMSGSTTADITRRPVHLGGTRVYDATRLVDVADLAIVDRDVLRTGLIVGQTLVLEGAGSIAAKQVGTDLPIELSQQETDPGLEPGGDGPTDGFEAVEGAVGITLADGEGGGLASNYTLTGGTHLFAVTPKPMTVSGLGAATRVYDGTTAVTLSGGTLVGTVPGDTVTLLGAGAGTAAAPTVGTHGVAVGASLGGADAGNYALSQPSVSVTFTTRQLSVEGLRVVSRPYDGGRRATLSGGRLVNVAPAGSGVTLTGATVGTYASPNAGTHTVAVSLGLSGPDAGNYALSPVSLSGSIVPAEARLRVLGGLTQLLGSVGLPSFGTEPPGLDGLTVEWLDGAAPSGPGSYLVVASLRGGNYVADPLTRTVTVLPAPEDERVRGTPVFGPQGVGGDGGGDGTSDGEDAGTAGRSGAAGDPGSLPGLEPGETLVLVDGVPTDAAQRPESGPDGTAGLGVSAGDVAAWFATRTADGADLPLGPEAELVVTPGGQLRVRGIGFQPRTTAEVWVFSEPRFLGTVPVGDDGTFAGEFPVAPDLEVGVHTAQLTGATPDGSVRAVNLGLRVLAADDPQLGLAASDVDGDAETARDRVEIVTTGSGPLGGDAWLLLALAGAALAGWWFLIGRRRRDEDEEELDGAGAVG